MVDPRIPLAILALIISGQPEVRSSGGIAFDLAALLGLVLAVALWRRSASRAESVPPTPER